MRAADEMERVIGTWMPAGLEDADQATHESLFDGWFGAHPVPLPGWIAQFASAAQSGFLDGWATVPRGRLALILLLGQAPRSLFAGTPAAFAGDADALRMAEDGFRAEHYDALEQPWERSFFLLPLADTEGPDHRERLIRLTAMAEAVAWSSPEYLRPLYRTAADRIRAKRLVITRFGRFPERNATLGRRSTAEEATWLTSGTLAPRRPAAPARLALVRPPQQAEAYPTTA